MTETAIQYTTVSTIDISEAMKASVKSTSASRSLDKADGTVWNQTVATVMTTCDFQDMYKGATPDHTKSVRKYLASKMAAHIMANTVLPEKGKDRAGKTITLCKGKDGKGGVKWSSWEETRRIWAYLGDIAKIWCYGYENLLYVAEESKVGARCDLLAMCKVTKSPIELVEQFVKSAQQQVDELETVTEQITAFKIVDSMHSSAPIATQLTSLTARLDALLESASEDDKSAIRENLLQVCTKHLG